MNREGNSAAGWGIGGYVKLQTAGPKCFRSGSGMGGR